MSNQSGKAPASKSELAQWAQRAEVGYLFRKGTSLQVSMEQSGLEHHASEFGRIVQRAFDKLDTVKDQLSAARDAGP